jgi:hypothetical protein
MRKMPGVGTPSRFEPVTGKEKRDFRLTAAFSKDEKRARLDRLATNSTRRLQQLLTTFAFL